IMLARSRLHLRAECCFPEGARLEPRRSKQGQPALVQNFVYPSPRPKGRSGIVSAMEFNRREMDRLTVNRMKHFNSVSYSKGDIYMKDAGVQLARREQQIVDLLIQGCDNAEISKQLNMAKRTVKAHFNRLFLRYGITSGIKRVKLATLLYRRQLCLQTNATE